MNKAIINCPKCYRHAAVRQRPINWNFTRIFRRGGGGNMDRGVNMKQTFLHFINGFIKDWPVHKNSTIFLAYYSYHIKQINLIVYWETLHWCFRRVLNFFSRVTNKFISWFSLKNIWFIGFLRLVYKLGYPCDILDRLNFINLWS